MWKILLCSVSSEAMDTFFNDRRTQALAASQWCIFIVEPRTCQRQRIFMNENQTGDSFVGWPNIMHYHNVLLSQPHSKFGISGAALEWFRSYLNGRSVRVMVQGNLSQSLNLDFGVPQGPCLGPFLFTIYPSKLLEVIKVHLSTVHCYADDTQLYYMCQSKHKHRAIWGCHCYTAPCGWYT